MTAKVDLLHNQTEHKERRQRGSFILNYGGNKSHYSDIILITGERAILQNSGQSLDMRIKKHPASTLKFKFLLPEVAFILGYLCSVLSINTTLTSLCDLVGFLNQHRKLLKVGYLCTHRSRSNAGMDWCCLFYDFSGHTLASGEVFWSGESLHAAASTAREQKIRGEMRLETRRTR